MTNRKRKRTSDGDDQTQPRSKKLSPRRLSFLNLPAELRNQIYSIALTHDPDQPGNTKHLSALPHYQSQLIQSHSKTKDDHTFQYISRGRSVEGKLIFKDIPGLITGSRTNINIALLITCKQIYQEARPMIFELNTFTADFEQLGEFCGGSQKVGEALGRLGFWKLLEKVVQPLWKQIKHPEMRWYADNLLFGDGAVLKNAALLSKDTGVQLRSLDWTVGIYNLPTSGASFFDTLRYLPADGPIRVVGLGYFDEGQQQSLAEQRQRSKAILKSLKDKKSRSGASNSVPFDKQSRS